MQAVADAHRREWASVLAATVRVARDLDLAEECVQDAYVAAMDAWPRQGVPANPGAWLTVAAQRRALNAAHARRHARSKLPLLVVPEADAEPDGRRRDPRRPAPAGVHLLPPVDSAHPSGLKRSDPRGWVTRGRGSRLARRPVCAPGGPTGRRVSLRC